MPFRPDPTFYPSPKMAMDAPRERFAYVTAPDANAVLGKPGALRDGLATVDLDPRSPTYGQIIALAEVPNLGDELHHSGWNACSAALCPYAPHPHVERRYLMLPALRSSRIYVFDVKPDPRNPKLVRTIEAEEIASRTGYSRPHTLHCGPDGIYVSALGSPSGDGPGGIFVVDCESFNVLGRWELDRGPQHLHYDFWWHLGHDTLISSEWGTPKMIEDGVNPELLLGRKYGHTLHVWDLRRRKHLQALDIGDEHQMALELRPAHDPTKAYGFMGCVISVKDLSASVWLWYREGEQWAIKKVIEIPAEPAVRRSLAAAAQGLRRRASALHGHQPLARRQIPLRLLLGHGGAASVRRFEPARAEIDGLGAHRRHRADGRRIRARAGRSRARRRWSRSAVMEDESTSRAAFTRPGTSSFTRTA